MKARCRRPIVAALLVVSAFAAGCGSGDDPSLTAPPSDAASSASLNEGDVEFLQAMIPHHEQATEMARLVDGRTKRNELREFAAKIIDDQSGEIDQMRQLLTAAGAEEGAGHGGMDGGMMDESEMTQLGGLSGDEFDLAFLDAMTGHHEGAIEMAEQVLEEGQNPQVADLANLIIGAQQAEIEQMAAWRNDWAS